MIFRDNTATNGYCLCVECKYCAWSMNKSETDLTNGVYFCSRLDEVVANVGICNLFEGRQEDATINR